MGTPSKQKQNAQACVAFLSRCRNCKPKEGFNTLEDICEIVDQLSPTGFEKSPECHEFIVL